MTTSASPIGQHGRRIFNGSASPRRPSPPIRFKSPPKAHCGAASNLLDRAFEASAPNQKWIADLTYIWTAEGWLYVAAVVDLFSRRVVGWAMKAVMTAQLVTDALIMAIWRRDKPDSLLHHSDQGFSTYQRAVPAADCRPRHNLFDEPIRQRLGQCCDGELLLAAQDGLIGPSLRFWPTRRTIGEHHGLPCARSSMATCSAVNRLPRRP